MIPVPKGNNRAYLQPVARVMQLYRHHIGSHAVTVDGAPDGLDVVASRRGDTVFLHVANTRDAKAVTATLQIAGHTVRGGRVFEIAADPTIELSYLNSADVMKTVEKPMTADGAWSFRRPRCLPWNSRSCRAHYLLPRAASVTRLGKADQRGARDLGQQVPVAANHLQARARQLARARGPGPRRGRARGRRWRR